MRSTWLLVVVISLVAINPLSLSAEEAHEGKKESTSSRAQADQKKPTSLAEKFSACLAERPGSDTKKDAAKGDDEKLGKTYSSQSGSAAAPQPEVSGADLFKQNCASCHSPNGSQGPIEDWALAAKRAGHDMPPTGKTFSDGDLAKLRAFFATQK